MIISSFTTITPAQLLEATRAQYQTLKAALETPPCSCGDGANGEWKLDYADGKLCIFGDFEESVPDLPGSFLPLLGPLIAKNGLAYLEFHIAVVGIEPVKCIGGGWHFRIRSDGSLWEPTITW